MVRLPDREPRTAGIGTSPQFPYDDWLVVEFRAVDGRPLASLLRTGNTADTVSSGLPWDRYLYRMQAADFEPLRGAGPVELVFTAQNDADTLPTDFWIDAVRFCVGPPGYRYFLPLYLQERLNKTPGTLSECSALLPIPLGGSYRGLIIHSLKNSSVDSNASSSQGISAWLNHRASVTSSAAVNSPPTGSAQ